MLNLVKMDLYRFSRTKSLIVMIAICLFIAAMYPIMTKITGEAGEVSVTVSIDEEISSDDDSLISESSTSDTDDVLQPSAADLFESICAGGNIMLLIVIFTTIFVCAEQRNGFIKNIAGQQRFRGSLIFSKIAVAAVFVALIFILTIIFLIISSLIVYKGDVILGFDTQFFKVVGVQYLLHFALSMLAILLCTLTRSSALSMTFGALIVAGLGSLICMLPNMLINKINGLESFDITNYAIENCIQLVTSGADSEILTQSIIVAAAYIVISGFAAVALMQKRDVK